MANVAMPTIRPSFAVSRVFMASRFCSWAIAQDAMYSVISPEGCAAILWKDSSQAARAAEELRLTAEDLHREGIVDQVIDEPEGGAQTSHDEAARLLDAVLCARLAESVTSKVDERLARRYQKMRQVGKWGISEPPRTP